MKIHRAAAAQFRCNLCLDWHTSRQPLQPASSINFCESCFQKTRSGSSFKIVDPVELEVYELCLKRIGVPSDESRSTNLQAIGELTEFYQRNGREEKLTSLFDLLGEFERLEAQAFQAGEPFRDFLNDLYRQQLSRVEGIWKSALSEIDKATALIEAERKRIKDALQSYQYDLQQDEAGLFDASAHAVKLGEVQTQLASLLGMQVSSLKEAFHQHPDQFFASDFTLKQALSSRQQVQIIQADFEEDSQLLQYTEKSEVADEPCYLPQQSMLLMESRKLGLLTVQSTERQPNSQKKVDPVADKQNLLNCTPLVFKQREHADSKPSKSTYLSNRKESLTQRDTHITRPSTTNKPRKSSVNPHRLLLEAYPPVDITTLKGWPREKILELLNRRNNIPKGYTSKRPSVLRVYPQRVMTSTICEALDNTLNSHSTIELIGYATQDLQFLGYLEMLKWTPRIELVKFVKVGLTDENFNLLLCFIAKAERAASLVVSNNYLTDQSVSTLLNFCRLHQQLKSVYMGRNYINQQRCKAVVAELRQMGTTVFV